MYVAYTAPHWPLHAHDEDIAKYKGRFDSGWDQLRVERLRRLVDSGILGDVTYIRTRIAHSGALDHWFGGHNAWFADKEAAGGGGLFDLGCHTVDITRWLGGPPKSVVAQMNSFSGTYPTVDDNAVGVVEFESGALGTMECAWVQRRGPNPIEVYGTEGYAGIRTAGRVAYPWCYAAKRLRRPSRQPARSGRWRSRRRQVGREDDGEPGSLLVGQRRCHLEAALDERTQLDFREMATGIDDRFGGVS